MTSDDSAPPSVLDLATRGYRATLQSQAVRVGCKAASVVLLARLVDPADHGRYAMAASVFSTLVIFRDCGLGAAAVQARELTEEQCTTLWRVHVGLGLGLAGLALALAWPAAHFYREPRVLPLLLLMAGALGLLAFNVWPRVLLGRELRFPELNALETRAAVLATLAMIAAGALGAGAYAFAVFLLVSEGLILIDAWRVCRWRPSAPARWGSLREFRAAALGLTGHHTLLAVLAQVDVSAMGRWFGAPALGLYSRPAQLLALPAQHLGGPLTQVLLATLSRLGPASAEFPRHVRSTTNLLAHLTLPLAVVCAVLPDEMLRLLLGRAWPEAAPLLRWLALGAAASYLSATLPSVCLASGRSRRLALMTGLQLLATAAGVWFGRHFGPVGLAAGAALAQVALLPVKIWWTARGTTVSPGVFGQALAGPVGLAAVSAAGMAAGHLLTRDAGWIVRLAGGLLGGALAGAALAAVWPQLRAEFRATWEHRPWRRGASPA